MKTIIFYDKETTGLPLFKEPSDHPGQPHVTQIAAELCIEETGEALASFDLLIRPAGWEIPPEVQELTGITMERANQFGVPIDQAMHALMELWFNADLRCGHNETFDARMARIELMRHAHYSKLPMLTGDGEILFPDYWKAGAAFCTMNASKSICNLPPTEKMVAARMKGPKSPNLKEAYNFFTGLELDGAHNARNDVAGCKAVYYAIKQYNANAAKA